MIADALIWLYQRGIAEYFRAWGNIHWFLYHYFSVPVLLRTFFAPFHRIREYRARGFDLEDWAGVFIVNNLMRFVGIVVRSCVFVLAFFAQILAAVFGFLFLVLLASSLIIAPVFILVGIALIT